MTQQLSPEEQAVLSERIRQGDGPAEEEFVRLFTQRIFVMIVTRTRNPETARDLTQETLVAVLLALRDGQVQQTDRLAGFIYGTARNILNNHFRACSRQPQGIPLDPEHLIAKSAVEIDAADRTGLVRRAMERLDAVDRMILHLTLVEGAKPGEIAQNLGLSSEVVRKRKSRAIKKIAETIKKLSRK
jgi:RNA polymerase sigma-70 factor, ECF subfamily